MKIDELHDRLFEVLCIIDDICRENNIRYYLDSGTELGSVREKDFIPWDDDMDLKIRAEDLGTFLRCMEKNLPEHLHIVTPKVFSPYFLDFVVRIYDDRYLIRKETKKDKAYGNYENRVGTDVFLLQKMPNSKLMQKILIFRIKTLYGFAMGHRYLLDNFKKYNLLQKFAVVILSGFGRCIPLSGIYRQYTKILRRYEKKDTAFRMCSNYPIKDLHPIPANAFEDTAFGEIRGRKFPIPAGYDTELTIIYGDYMTPSKDMNAYERHLDKEDGYNS